MYLTIYAAGMPFNGETILQGKSLGGSESAAYYMARELVKFDNDVTVFTTSQKTGRWDGVKYEWVGEMNEQTPLGHRYMFAMQSPQDVIVAQRHPLAFSFAPASKLNIWWLHDLALGRTLPHIQKSLVNIDSIFTVSEFHKEQVHKVYGVDKEHIFATQNGFDYNATSLLKVPPYNKREKNSLLFASRPERGLESIIQLADLMPDYKFYVCSYENTVNQMVNYYHYLWEECRKRKNIKLLGALSKGQLWSRMREVKAIIYPTAFQDTSNMLAIEGAANGCPFIGPAIAALPETTRGGFASLVNLKDGQVDVEAFKMEISLLCQSKEDWELKHRKALANNQSWMSIAEKWNSFFKQKLTEKCKDKHRLAKHFEHNSDIVALTKNALNSHLPDFKQNYDFYLKGDYKEHYTAYYRYEKNRGVNYGPETLDGNSRFECISDIVGSHEGESVLDFGCAHGHYTINLAKRFPDKKFIGLDIEQTNIDKAIDWQDQDGVSNTAFWCGEFKSIAKDKVFDIIIFAEVLEHVPNPQEIVDYLHDNFLSDDGLIIVSVPYGAWEAIGYNEHKGWRAHIHHFERKDLYAMFGGFNDYRNLALPNSHSLGHYVASFTKTPGHKCGEINYLEKAYEQSPRETISLCMIVRDAEDTIGKCIKNIGPYVDEIIIGIDVNSSPKTKWTIESLPYQVETFTVDSPLAIGFDEARNLTIEKATCDWILWLDDDESFEYPEKIWKYLRNNSYNGYMIAQHHFAVEPPGVLQTDFPVRIFRNHKGIKFFGVVHEHPSFEEGCNTGVGAVYQPEDLAIAHTGYATEAKRRKRFHRNFPLIERDREKYPERILGKYLYLRDLTHSVRYVLEQNGSINQCNALAQNVISLWEELLRDENTHVRYIVQSLPYYSECVKLVSNGNGINYKGLVGQNPIEGVFHNTDMIKKLTERLIVDATDHFNAEYY